MTLTEAPGEERAVGAVRGTEVVVTHGVSPAKAEE